MKSKLELILLLIIIFLALISCDNSTNPLDEDSQIDTLYSSIHFLWPSTVGSYWDFKSYNFFNHYNIDSNWSYEGFASFGLDLDTIQSEPSLYRREIVDSIFINIHDTMYECHVFDGYDPETKKYKNFKTPYWIGEDGIYNMGIYGERGDTVFSKGLYIPAEIPLNVNWGGQMSYKQYGYFHASPVLARKCLSKNEVINTPLGELECHVIWRRIKQADDLVGYYDYYEYYAPEIGMVCGLRLSVTPIFGPNYYGWWWLEHISVTTNYSIN